jgi:DNA repair exonuclease SbcCD ATPase subunit
MGQLIPRSEAPLNGSGLHRARGPHEGNGKSKLEPSPQANTRMPAELAIAEHAEDRHGVKPPSGEITIDEEIRQLRGEVHELQTRNLDLERTLEESGKFNEELLAEKQRELDTLVEEKTEVIRDLYRQIHDLEGAEPPPSGTNNGSAPREEELLALSEELERERRQLKEDEESLMQQMREMEVQMSRERAEFARQRSELERLHSEIRHELELAGRDAALRERLAPLQRRHQDIVTRRGASPPAVNVPLRPAAAAAPPKSVPPRKDSGLFRRFFG